MLFIVAGQPFGMKNELRIPSLDGIRGIAILLVLSRHCFAEMVRPPLDSNDFIFYLAYFLQAGWCGVDLFFVLSGFLLGGILIDHNNSRNTFTVFYFRRICRILPLYFLLLSPLLFAHFTGAGKSIPKLDTLANTEPINWALYPSFLQNFSMTFHASFGDSWLAPTWSLCVEEQFYLLLPWIIRFTPINKLPKLLIFFIVSSTVLRLILFLWLPQRHAFFACYTLLPCRWDTLFIGVLIAYVVRQNNVLIFIKTKARILKRLLFLFGSIVFLLLSRNPDIMEADLLMMTIGCFIIAIFFGLVILASFVIPIKLFNSPALRMLGRISFFIYLFHIGILKTVFHVLAEGSRGIVSWSGFGIVLIAILFTILLGILSFLCFERHFLRFGHSLSYKP